MKKLSLMSLLKEEDEKTNPAMKGRQSMPYSQRNIPQERHDPGPNPRQNRTLMDHITKMMQRLKLSHKEMGEIFGTPKVDPNGHIILSLPVAQSLVNRFGDLDRIAEILEPANGPGFMQMLLGVKFRGFNVPQMSQVRQPQNKSALPPEPETPQIVQDFSREIEED